MNNLANNFFSELTPKPDLGDLPDNAYFRFSNQPITHNEGQRDMDRVGRDAEWMYQKLGKVGTDIKVKNVVTRDESVFPHDIPVEEISEDVVQKFLKNLRNLNNRNSL